MKNVYKQGGAWTDKKGREYTVKSVSSKSFRRYIESGWYEHLDDCFAIEAEYKTIPEQGSEYEADLRAKIKELGGKPGGRSSIKTLEKQLEELKNGQ